MRLFSCSDGKMFNFSTPKMSVFSSPYTHAPYSQKVFVSKKYTVGKTHFFLKSFKVLSGARKHYIYILVLYR